MTCALTKLASSRIPLEIMYATEELERYAAHATRTAYV